MTLRPGWIAIVACGLVTVASCTASDDSGPAQSFDPANPDGVNEAPQVADEEVTDESLAESPEGVKPTLSGLVDRQGFPAGRNADLVSGVVIEVDWADLQPVSGDELAEPNAIDRALREAAASAIPRRLKLRVDTGFGAPDWLIDEVGGVDGASRTVPERGDLPRFWDDRYIAAYGELQRVLSERYDSESAIAEVVMSGCMTVYAEPLIRTNLTPETQQALIDVGLTSDLDHNCLRETVSAHDVWTQTSSSLALNPHHELLDGGGVRSDAAFALELAAWCREQLGTRCVLQNNSIRWPLLDGSEYQELYAGVEALGPPLAFQTATPERIGDWAATIDWAIGVGAASVELNRSYHDYDTATLAEFADRLAANTWPD